MAKRKYHIVSKNPDGTPKLTHMRTWIRENPDIMPAGIDARRHVSQLKRVFRGKGWEIEELGEKILIIIPDENGDISFVDELLENEAREDEDQDDEFAEAAEITFGLERDLQSALRSNISQLEAGLKIIDDGKERITDAGEIDITAEDSKGNVVIIELKAGVAAPAAIAQVLAYMGAVAEHDKVPVRGILVAGDFHKRVVWAARAIPNLELKKYSFQFSFESLT